jgi:hypothetical protein
MAGIVGNRAAFGRDEGDHKDLTICAMRISRRQASRQLETRNFDDLNLGERNYVGQ